MNAWSVLFENVRTASWHNEIAFMCSESETGTGCEVRWRGHSAHTHTHREAQSTSAFDKVQSTVKSCLYMGENISRNFYSRRMLTNVLSTFDN